MQVGLLPKDLGAAVETATGATIIAITPRGGGGASREGAELQLRWADGRSERAYMNYDVHRAGAGDDAAFLREAAILRAFSGSLKHLGVLTAPFIAAIPKRRALISGFVGGEANFNKLTNTDERLAVARNFMTQLALLHRIDVAANPIEGMGTPEPVEATIRRRITALRASNTGTAWDPLIHLALDWLSNNVPASMPAPVIVHGDAGPANFLYADGKVTALLDWELVHYGDPMADLAMLCLRDLFQPFVPMQQAFGAYDEAGGHRVDLGRVRYWRLLFQTGFARATRLNDPDAPPPPNLGMNLIYSTIHRRVLSEALAEVAGVPLSSIVLPDLPQGPRHRAFTLALDDVRATIVPRLSDERAAVKAKGLARLIKYWRDIERYEPTFKKAECAEINAALGTDFVDCDAAWAAFCEAVQAGTCDPSAAIRLCNVHEARHAALMADAMGGLALARFAALE